MSVTDDELIRVVCIQLAFLLLQEKVIRKTLPLSKSHNFIEPSNETEAILVPAGLTATEVIELV